MSICYKLLQNNEQLFLMRASSLFPIIKVPLQRQRSVFQIAPEEKTVVLVIGPLSLLVASFNIAALLGLKPLRQPPADILLFITIFSILKLLVIYTTMIYNQIYPMHEPLPSNYEAFCLASGFINILATMSKVVYTLIFCLYYITKIRNPLKAWINQNKEMHFLCAFAVILLTFIFYLTNSIGVSVYGYCSIKFSDFSEWIAIIIQIGYTIILIVASTIFLKYIKQVSHQRDSSVSFFRYYCCFLIVFCINEFILTLNHLLVEVACQMIDQNMFNISKAAVDLCQSVSPFFVLVILISNPQFKKAMIIQVFRSIYDRYKHCKNKKNQHQEDSQQGFYDELMSTHRNTIYMQLTNLASNNNGYLSKFKDKNRACFLSTLLGCLSVHHLQLKNYSANESLSSILRTSAVEDDQNPLFAWNYTQTCIFSVNHFIVQQYQHIFIKKIPTVSIKFVSYAPNILHEFVEMNKIDGLAEALAPTNNQDQIIEDSKTNGEGGRSGQFFFFNYNNTLILKTIKNSQREVYLKRLQSFHEHYKDNPDSLIVKMLTLFSAINTDTNQEINFMLMGNILRTLSKKYVLRSYDLKGSYHSRQILKNNQIPDTIIKKTLKDIDFCRLQQKIWVSTEDAARLKHIISKDSTFLCRMQLIDYSLIVMKIDLKSITQENKGQKDMLKNLQYFESVRQSGVAYVMGIIDYLQTWNIRKKGEKWYKSLFNKTKEISSQDPNFYSERFIRFCNSILTFQ